MSRFVEYIYWSGAFIRAWRLLSIAVAYRIVLIVAYRIVLVNSSSCRVSYRPIKLGSLGIRRFLSQNFSAQREAPPLWVNWRGKAESRKEDTKAWPIDIGYLYMNFFLFFGIIINSHTFPYCFIPFFFYRTWEKYVYEEYDCVCAYTVPDWWV